MQEHHRATSLQLDQDPRAQHQEWRFERSGWATIALLVAAALAGLFGDGPITHATSRSGAAAIEYDRTVRYGTSATFALSLPPAAGGDTMATVSLDRAFLDDVDVDHIVPEPVETRASATLVEYHFRRTEARAPLRVEFAVKATSIGARHARVGTSLGPIVFRQFVLP
jgi:hypothetical protein